MKEFTEGGKKLTEVSSNSRRGVNNARSYETIYGGGVNNSRIYKKIHGGGVNNSRSYEIIHGGG